MSRRFWLIPGLMALCLLANRANADSIAASLIGVSWNPATPTATNADIVSLSYGTTAYSGVYAGELQWQSSGTSTEFLTSGTDFGTYCIDILHDIEIGDGNNGGAPYAFNVEPLNYMADNLQNSYQFNSNYTNAQALEDLYSQDRYVNSLSSADASAAFQIAIWEILFGNATFNGTISGTADPLQIGANVSVMDMTTALLGTVKLDLTSGTYHADTGLDALITPRPVGGANVGQDQALFQSGVTPLGSPFAVPLPRASLAGFSLLGGFGLLSFLRRRSGFKPS